MRSSANTKAANSGLSYKQLISLFHSCFKEDFHTCLEAGFDEPYYCFDQQTGHARICFRENFASSALHEVAHWCIAGAKRRTQNDYGYWYKPDGRSANEQREFEQVEIKPQALEWIFSVAAGIEFNLSADNLNGDKVNHSGFAQAVVQQAKRYLMLGLPARANIFYKALCVASNIDNADREIALSNLKY